MKKYIFIAILLISLPFSCLNINAQHFLFTTQESIDTFNCSIASSIHLDDRTKNYDNLTPITNIDKLICLQEAGAILIENCPYLTNISGLLGVKKLTNLKIRNNSALKSLNGLQNCSSYNEVTIKNNSNLESLSGFKPDTIYESISILDNPSLKDFNGLSKIIFVEDGAEFVIQNNSMLGSLEGLFEIHFIQSGALNILDNQKLVEIGGLTSNRIDRLIIQDNPMLAKLDFHIDTLGNGQGNVNIDNNESLNDLTGLSETIFEGNLFIQNNSSLKNLSGLSNFTSSQDIYIQNNASLISLEGFSEILFRGSSSYLYIQNNPSLISLEGLSGITFRNTFSSRLYIQNNPALVSLNGFSNASGISELHIQNNPSLISLKGISDISSVSEIYIQDNESLNSLEGLSEIKGCEDLYIQRNPSLVNLSGFKNFKNGPEVYMYTYIRDNENLINLVGLENDTIEGNVYIENNASLKSLEGLSGITFGGSASKLFIQNNNSLINLDGFNNCYLNTDVYIKKNKNLRTLEGIKNDTIEGNLYIEENPLLTSLKGIEGMCVNNVFIQYNPSLNNLTGLSKMSFNGFNNRLYIQDNDGLINLDGFSNGNMDADIYIKNNKNLLNLNGFDNDTIFGDVHIEGNPALNSLEGFNIFNIINEGFLDIYITNNSSLTNLNGLDSVKIINSHFPEDINGLAIRIENNKELVDVSIFEKVDVRRATLKDNPKLSDCCPLSYYDNITLENNLPGCNSSEELTICPPFTIDVYNVSPNGSRKQVAEFTEDLIEKEPIKVTADGTTSTVFQISSKSGMDDFSFFIHEGQDSLVYGKFLEIEQISSHTFEIEYQHPDTLLYDFLKNNQLLTVSLFDGGDILKQFEINVVLPPILFIPGRGFDQEKVFNEFCDNLTNNGLFLKEELYLASYSENELTQKNLNNHTILIKNLDGIKKSYLDNNISIGKINVVGHSAGGILARLYSESVFYTQRNDINKIITINSPHKGSQLYTLNKKVNELFIDKTIWSFSKDIIADIFIPEAKDPIRYSLRSLEGFLGFIDLAQFMWDDIFYYQSKEKYAKQGLDGFTYTQGDFDLSHNSDLSRYLNNVNINTGVPCISLGSYITGGFAEDELYYELHSMNSDILAHSVGILNFKYKMEAGELYSGFDDYLQDLFMDSCDLISPITSQLCQNGITTTKFNDHLQTLDNVSTFARVDELLHHKSSSKVFTDGFNVSRESLKENLVMEYSDAISDLLNMMKGYAIKTAPNLDSKQLKNYSFSSGTDTTFFIHSADSLNSEDIVDITFSTSKDIDYVFILSSDGFFHADSLKQTTFNYKIPFNTIGATSFIAFMFKDSAILDHSATYVTWNTNQKVDSIFGEYKSIEAYEGDSVYLKIYGNRTKNQQLLNFSDSISFSSTNSLLTFSDYGVFTCDSAGRDTIKVNYQDFSLLFPINIRDNISTQLDFTIDFDANVHQIKRGEELMLFAKSTKEKVSFSWHLSGCKVDSSFLNNPSFILDSIGTLEVKLQGYYEGEEITLSREFCVYNDDSKPSIIYEKDTFCEGNSLMIKSSCTECENTWSNGIIADSIYIWDGGEYYVTAYDGEGCGVSSEPIYFNKLETPSPEYYVQNDTLKAIGDYEFLWSIDNEIVPNNNSYISMQAGHSFQVLAKNKNGCYSMSEIFTLTNDAVIENEKNLVKVFPNPFNNQLSIFSNLDFAKYTVCIFDITGKLVFSSLESTNNLELNLDFLKKGIYLLNIKTDENVFMETIVKN